MRIGVVSDTHGKPEFLRKALEQMGHIDLLIHAGDHYRDALNISKETGIKVIAVAGNCDPGSGGPEEQVMELEGRRIMVTHGHLYGVKSGHERLVQLLREGRYDLVIFGHSHESELTVLPQGYLMNPGSLASPRRGSQRSYGTVEIGKNGLVPHIHDLKW